MSHFPPLRTVAVADTRYYKFVGECRQCGDGAGGKVVNLLLFAALVALWIGVNRFLCESLESLDVRACAHRTRISIHAHHNTRTQTGLLGVRPDEQRDRKLQRQVASRLQRIRAAHIFRLGLRCRHHQFRCRPRLDCAAVCTCKQLWLVVQDALHRRAGDGISACSWPFLSSLPLAISRLCGCTSCRPSSASISREAAYSARRNLRMLDHGFRCRCLSCTRCAMQPCLRHWRLSTSSISRYRATRSPCFSALNSEMGRAF